MANIIWGGKIFMILEINYRPPIMEIFLKILKNIKFKTYGEYGCPFNGMMFDLLKEEINNKNYLKDL